MSITSVDERVKKFKNLYQDQMQEQINASNNMAAQQKATVQDTYNSEIAKTKTAYDDEYRLNEVQKYVNEKQLAESMANAGLTDSGLNRTQQTAIQLSYANNKSKINQQMQSAVNAFVLTMNSKLADIETSRISNEASIKQSYDNTALSAAQKEYQTEYDAMVDVTKAEINAQADLLKEQQKAEKEAQQKTGNLINVNGQLIDRSALNNKSLEDNGIQVVINKDKETTTYIDTVTGKKTTLQSKQNPFVSGANQINPDTDYGTFSNGYQPNNVDNYKLSKSGAEYGDQNVWTYHDDKKQHFVIWDGMTNKYYEFTKTELEQLGIDTASIVSLNKKSSTAKKTT